ncbi:MAG: S8/S53 family peptidase [Pseudomonadota bacterium]|nr:S8/S53 family peptidase [Pseudomonadota bacterium]
MRISVLAQIPSEEPLRRSAMSMRESPKAPPRPIDVTELKYSGPLEIDPFFPAVPLGGGAGLSEHESMAMAESDSFAVRATIEVASAQDIPEKIDGNPIFADPRIETFLTCANSAAVGNHDDVAGLLGTAALHAAGCDGSKVAIAIVDGGINLDHLKQVLGRTPQFDPGNSWTPPRALAPPFAYPVGHGTMCAYDALIAAPRATLIDVPVLGRFAGGSVMSGSLSAAVQAYSFMLSSWAVAFAAGGLSQYESIVLSNSWGMYTEDWDFPEGHKGRYCDNPDHPFDIIVSALVRFGIDIVFAAGNCGADCPSSKCDGVTAETIMGANAHGDVLTVAGCDTQNRRVGYSSMGPSIRNRVQEKPDLTGYTHFMGSQVGGANVPDTGTSAACPVVAGVIAALRSARPGSSVPPTNLADILRSTARKGVGQVTGVPRDDHYGRGIIDPVSAAGALGIIVS